VADKTPAPSSTSNPEPERRYARLAVNVPHVQGIFDYHLPPQSQDEYALGQLVEVPFGRQDVQGVIIEFPAIPAVPETKAAGKILDPDPVVTEMQIELAWQISRETLSPLGVTLLAMVPAGLSVQADTEYRLSEESASHLDAGQLVLEDISSSQQHLLDLLLERGPLRGRQLDRALPHKNWRKSAGALMRRGVLESQATLEDPSVKPKTERQLMLKAEPSQALEQMESLARSGFSEALARRQAVLKRIMASDQPLPLSEIYQETGANLSDLEQLGKRGLTRIIEVPVLRDPLEDLDIQPSTAPRLTPDQARVWEPIQRAFTESQPDPFLLQGVTGSGKTEIYLLAVEEAIRQGKQAIILVPEIALTPQTVSRFMSRFPGRVGVLHSELSPGERYDTWRLARAAALDIVVGPRSALFTPFPNPGLIVVDECHDSSYYQGDLTPRYHALPTAVAYARISGAVCILGSATPDVATRYHSDQGRWTYLSLPERILAHRASIQVQLNQARQVPEIPRYQAVDDDLQMTILPEVEIVDMREELKAGNRTIFSQSLQEALEFTLAKDQQAILFLNRRGSASYVFCRDCGYAMRCPRCDTSLTAHLSDNSLRCHHCGYQRSIPQRCPSCGSQRIRQLGTGTEQVEAAVRKLLPDARTMRWDRDTTRSKGAHWEIMERFSSHQADVIIGTQMLAKGLDLPLVTLVGVVLAESGLHLPDYRASERTFQVLTQVAGRAGRSPLGGQVIMQTFEPENYVIQAAAGHDYQGFYDQEIRYRQELGYPPFQNLVRLEVRDRDYKAAESKIRTYAAALEGWISKEGYRATSLVGPTPPYFSRIRGENRWQLLVKGPDPVQLIRDHHPGPDWIIEVNPPAIL
jgi:primosomal protein N' (replication factor Y) (superfamily II helicase)